MNPYDIPNVPIETHTFPIHELARCMRIDANHVPANMQASLVKEMFGRMLCEIRERSVRGEYATETIKVPADWWAHFKQRWFPTWALHRWPARTRTIDVRITRICPHIKIDDRTASYGHIQFLLGRDK